MKLHFIFLLYLFDICPFYALAQTGPSPSPDSAITGGTQANQNQATTASGQASQSGTELNQVIVVGQLDQARDQIVPYLGATKYSIGQQQIQTQSQGANAPFNQVILRAPGVAQDSFGQLGIGIQADLMRSSIQLAQFRPLRLTVLDEFDAAEPDMSRDQG